jgi:hypothetical protein
MSAAEAGWAAVGRSSAMISESRQASAIAGALVFPDMPRGITDMSATRRFSTP